MKPDLQRRVQRYGWDKAAPYYETGWQEQLRPAQKSLLFEVDPKPGEQVLDISCGTGLVSLPIAEIVQPGGEATGVDLSKEMIRQAQSRAENKGIENICFKQMDAESLELPADSFDVVICSLGLMYFPHPQKALQEMYRVLKPGGRATALVWGERGNCGWAGVFPITDRRVESEVCPLFFQLGTGKALLKTFEEAKFEDVTSNRFSYDLHFRDKEQACTAAFLGGAVALAYQKFDEETRKEANREYLKSIKQFHNGKGYNVPGEFVITSGIKPGKTKEPNSNLSSK